MKFWSAIFLLLLSASIQAQRFMEDLNRGLVVLRQSERSVFISWRMLGTEPDAIAYNVYRVDDYGKTTLLTKTPVTSATCFVDSLANLTKTNSWFVKAVVNKKEQAASKAFQLPANAPVQTYLSIPLKTPTGYTPNDASVGDLDGDGEYDIVIHMSGKGHDNSQKGFTDPPILQGYKLDGTLLWSINLGKNIREGAHYTQFMVYDLDGDGKSEVACKTADGTIDGLGKAIGDINSDHRNQDGYILKGPEYLTIFNGLTGAALTTTNYVPGRHPETNDPDAEQLKAIWGDGYGNRVDRFLACIAYLDGIHPSLITARGYYTRTVLSAWNWRDGNLTHLWTFDSDTNDENRKFRGQGNHNLSVADVDNDGKDEIIYGACVFDDNGTGLTSTGFGHGDALHVSNLDPSRPGLEIFDIQERFDDAGAHLRDARTGEVLWKKASVRAGDDGEGPGRGNSFDIDPRYPGNECWVRGAGITGLFNVKGEKISDTEPSSCNFAVWWDGDLLREILDKNVISKWDWNTSSLKPLLIANECSSNNGTKATPVLSADLFGDWREEVIWRTTDNSALHIYSTTLPTSFRFTTLMHDPVYRLGVAWQNVAYNQPPHASYYLGTGMQKHMQPHIRVVKNKK